MDDDGPIRLQKYIAEAGVASRRQAEALIAEGRVSVDGAPATIGQKIDPRTQRVVVDGRTVRPSQKQRRLVLAMNKPKGYICSNRDPYNPQTVFDLLPPDLQRERLFCAGRLDKDSQGLVILTNDGDLANRITHPSNGIVKRYRVRVHRAFDPAAIPKMLRGITREGERLYAKKVIPATAGPEAEYRLEVHLVQGRKREIRRLLEAFGYFVKKLERVQIGRLELKRLPTGSHRRLSDADVRLMFKGGD